MIEPRAAPVMWFPDHGGISGTGTPGAVIVAFRLTDRHRPDVHILMIEDDGSIAEMYRLQLEHDGYRVSVATTGELAYSTLSGSAPDLVLLDLLLPDRSGFEVLAALNERFPQHPPVVILSNYGEPSMIDRGRELGAIEYLVKSRVTPAEISVRIPGWVEQGRGRRQKES
jgi:DNA-binding response OmpR family regulator